jgi:hypothetical protein
MQLDNYILKEYPAALKTRLAQLLQKQELHLYSIHRYVNNASANPLTEASPKDE